jgi:serine/threonine-protein kinase
MPDLEGKYEILRKLSEGGMGAIYQVRHRPSGEFRVVKIIRKEHQGDASLKIRFEREAKTALRLQHPNIARIHDFKLTADGTAYMVLEYVDGITLQELLRLRRPPSLGLALEIADQALGALVYLHGLGFIHRDIAPDNLMVGRRSDGAPRVKLIDLGVAKDVVAGSSLTVSGTFLGKVRYCAPEGFTGDSAKVTAQSDLYSFGLVLYELLTGVFPIEGRNFSEIVAGHLFKPLMDFDDSDPKGRVSPGLRHVVRQALERSPQKRIASAEALRQALAAQGGSAGADPAELQEILTRAASLTTEEAEEEEPGSSQARLNRELPITRKSPLPVAPPAGPISSVVDLLPRSPDVDRTLVRGDRLSASPLDDEASKAKKWLWAALAAAALAALVLLFGF